MSPATRIADSACRVRPRVATAKAGWSVATLTALVTATPVYACTLCHSRLAEEVRAVVFGPEFWTNTAMLLLPMPIMLTAACVVVRSLP